MNSEDSATRSHTLAWIISLIVALPLIYLLSVPPVVFAAMRLGGFNAITSPPPPALVYYMAPYLWLEQKTLLKRPLNAYGEWWKAVAFPKSPKAAP